MQKLLETKKVARILEVAKKTAEQLVESPRDRGRGDCSIKLCSLRPKVQSLTLCIPFLTRGTPFVYLPLKNCTLFIYLLHENKSIRKVVFRLFSSNLQLNFHVIDIAIRRVSSKHFNERPFKIGAVACYVLQVYMPFYSVFPQNRCEWCGCFPCAQVLGKSG